MPETQCKECKCKKYKTLSDPGGESIMMQGCGCVVIILVIMLAIGIAIGKLL